MWIEQKYIRQLSNNLERFKEKSPVLYNFRCPYCGDSIRNKTRTRGYLLTKGSKFLFYCHNCQKTASFKQFLKYINPALYDAYLLENYQTKLNEEAALLPLNNKPIITVKLNNLWKVSQLTSTHSCKKYIVSRQIPSPYHAKLYYTDRFKSWVNSCIPNKFENINQDEPRLVIPLFYEKELVGFQGRSLNPQNPLRYITIMFDEDHPKIYGLDTVDFNRKYYVFEGPFDSMFIPNSIATCGGNLVSEIEDLDRCKNNAVIVYDNEPRNPEIVKNISTAIRKGFKVCIWPDTVKHKDINDMILAKVSGDYVKTESVQKEAEKIKNVIDACIFQGLEAELRLTEWKKT